MLLISTPLDNSQRRSQKQTSKHIFLEDTQVWGTEKLNNISMLEIKQDTVIPFLHLQIAEFPLRLRLED